MGGSPIFGNSLMESLHGLGTYGCFVVDRLLVGVQRG